MEHSLASIPIPVRLRTQALMTDQELMRFSRENLPLRVEREPNGEILVMTLAGFRTSKMNQRVGRLLDEWAEADGRGVVTDSNGGYKLPDGSVRAPDVGWLSREKMDQMSEAEQEGFAPVCPEFVIELRSPSDGLVELQAKMKMWLANGAELGWLIDPLRKVVEVYRVGEPAEVWENPTSVRGVGCVSGFDLVMGRVWG